MASLDLQIAQLKSYESVKNTMLCDCKILEPEILTSVDDSSTTSCPATPIEGSTLSPPRTSPSATVSSGSISQHSVDDRLAPSFIDKFKLRHSPKPKSVGCQKIFSCFYAILTVFIVFLQIWAKSHWFAIHFSVFSGFFD